MRQQQQRMISRSRCNRFRNNYNNNKNNNNNNNNSDDVVMMFYRSRNNIVRFRSTTSCCSSSMQQQQSSSCFTITMRQVQQQQRKRCFHYYSYSSYDNNNNTYHNHMNPCSLLIRNTTTSTTTKRWEKKNVSFCYSTTPKVLVSSVASSVASTAAHDDEEDDVEEEDIDDSFDSSLSSSSSYKTETAPVVHSHSCDDGNDDDDDWLVRLRNVQFEYTINDNTNNDDDNNNNDNDKHNPKRMIHIPNFIIRPAKYGGHVLLGRNGTGKSLISNAIMIAYQQQQQQQQQQSTSVTATNTTTTTNNNNAILDPIIKGIEYNSKLLPKKNLQYYSTNTQYVSRVSFESHEQLLELARNNNGGGGMTVYSALTPNGGQLNKATQYLVVRFGLYSMLSRDVRTLSTGEIRKVLLLRALSTKPKLLVLDNVYDGLDVASRDIVKDIVQKTLRGFTNDLLVQGINAQNTEHTQILLITHRPEYEIVPEISTISYFKNTTTTATNDDDNSDDDRQSNYTVLRTQQAQQQEQQQTQQPKQQQWLATQQQSPKKDDKDFTTKLSEQYNHIFQSDYNNQDSTLILPSIEDIQEVFNSNTNTRENEMNHNDNDNNKQYQECSNINNKSNNCSDNNKNMIIDLQNVTIQRGDATLLHNINWNIVEGQRWLLAGGNGMGKSTLSRGIAQQSIIDFNKTSRNSDRNKNITSKEIGWVSTEQHLSMSSFKQKHQQQQQSQFSMTGLDILRSKVGISDNDDVVPFDVAIKIAGWMNIHHHLLNRPFIQLSQGEQKLILIGAAIAKLPKLLILDEPLQGLDYIHRKFILSLLERICQATTISLIYVTHHLDELIPSISHVLHLKDGRSIYNGSIYSYNPNDYF